MNTRRTFVQLLAAGAAPASQAQTKAPLTEKDRIDAGGRGKEMIERAYRLGAEYAKLAGCAQGTVAALQDALDFLPKSDDVFRAASCLDGGATADRNANCGGFTGAGIVIGHLCGRARAAMSDREAARLCHKLLREVAQKYQESYGSVLCKDVRGKANANCADVAGKAAQWAAEAILKQFT